MITGASWYFHPKLKCAQAYYNILAENYLEYLQHSQAGCCVGLGELHAFIDSISAKLLCEHNLTVVSGLLCKHPYIHNVFINNL